jgi:ABC-type transport system involved in multi-copper enzyme maturation permease subunit
VPVSKPGRIAFFSLVEDTFREAFARKIFWGYFGLSTLLIFFFLFLLKIDIVEGAVATITLFGREQGPTMDVTRLVQQACAAIAVFLTTWGLFLAVFASGGLVPSLLEPGRIELLLSKPVPRYQILLGRYLGILLVVALNVTYLVLGIWSILGTKTGIWSMAFLWAIPATVFSFAALLSLVTLVGVVWDSAAVSIMAAVALMILSPILAQERIMIKLLSSEWSRQLWVGLYHALPKIYDIGRMTLDAVQHRPLGDPRAIVTTAMFGCVTLGAGLWIFQRRDF